jgi:cell division septation protein DedD
MKQQGNVKKQRHSVPLALSLFIFMLLLVGIVTAMNKPSGRFKLEKILTLNALHPEEQKPAKLFYENVGKSEEEAPQPDEPTAGQPATGTQNLYTIEVMVLRSEQEAEEWVAKLEQQGQAAFYTPLHISGKVFFRVRVGTYQTAHSATTVLNQLRGLGYRYSQISNL